jgi:hypothetical protein
MCHLGSLQDRVHGIGGEITAPKTAPPILRHKLVPNQPEIRRFLKKLMNESREPGLQWDYEHELAKEFKKNNHAYSYKPSIYSVALSQDSEVFAHTTYNSCFFIGFSGS